MNSIICPQPGAQEQFINIPTDINIVFYGGAAGGGKSFALLMDALKYVDCPNFYAVYFRRTTGQLERTLWPAAKALYMPFLIDNNGKFMGKARIREKDHKIVFPSGAILEFSYMEHDKDADLNWQGAELTGVYWDEFSHFSEYQFNYLRTRLRSNSKYPSYMRASMNPDSEHFVVRWIEPWILESGLANREISGKTRYFIFNNGDLHTSWSREDLEKEFPGKKARTYTFIPSLLKDNPKMLEKNPDYEEELSANNRKEKETLLDGRWNVKLGESNYFQRSWLNSAKPPLNSISARGYDKAGTEPSEVNRYPDYTAGIKLSKDRDGFYYLQGSFHPEFKDSTEQEIFGRFRKRAGERDTLILKQAKLDGSETTIILSSDPGMAGKVEFQESAKKLAQEGFVVKQDPTPHNKSKLTRFTPFASACENGLVFVDEDSFPNKATLEAFYKELESFNGERSTSARKDD